MIECPLIKTPIPAEFKVELERLGRLFGVYALTSPSPLPASNLRITTEIRLQSEFYLPVSQVRKTAYRIYRAALSTEPVFNSTPFHSCPSWADCFSSLPGWLQFSSNPSRLFSNLLSDRELFHKFIFHSFIPSRFNGQGAGRYPEQQFIIKEHLSRLKSAGKNVIRVLDAACGTGEGTWELALLLSEAGFDRGSAELHGWTVDPLEVWAAENTTLPHDYERTVRYKKSVEKLSRFPEATVPIFTAINLLNYKASPEPFDLIVCNGLIGGPIIGTINETKIILQNFQRISKPASTILIADSFHEGWKKKLPAMIIRALLHEAGFNCGEDQERTITGTRRVLV